MGSGEGITKASLSPACREADSAVPYKNQKNSEDPNLETTISNWDGTLLPIILTLFATEFGHTRMTDKRKHNPIFIATLITSNDYSLGPLQWTSENNHRKKDDICIFFISD